MREKTAPILNQIPWFKMEGLRNRIVHDYEGVNLNLIWKIIDIDINILKEQLLKLIQKNMI